MTQEEYDKMKEEIVNTAWDEYGDGAEIWVITMRILWPILDKYINVKE